MASSSFKGSAISISDEDSDDSFRFRSRVRHKRKKLAVRGTAGIFLRFIRKIERWWPLLILFPSLGLLFYEISGIYWKNEDGGVVVEAKDSQEEVQKYLGNLNRLNPMTRVVNGVREPCLKILSPGEIEQLKFPASAKSNFPVKKMLYKSASGTPSTGDNTSLLHQQTENNRFNQFTGVQTMDEREESFKVRETVSVHCGFYNESGGFKISEEDKNFMHTCEAVVSTCAFGGGDDLYQPIGMTKASLTKVCYVAFWDEITVAAQQAESVRINVDHMIGKWRIVVVRDLPFSDQRLNGKIPKMLSHRLFPRARYSIWVDAKSQFRRDPLAVLEALLWRVGATLAISEHGARSSVFEEGRAVVKKNKASPGEVQIQLNQYRRDGFSDDKRFNGKKALAEASIIVREHTPGTNLLMCIWFNEVVRFTSRDQLSFPYVLRRLGLQEVNIFPVCTRKDMVNSMGHRRKVKPLAGGK
ncbi:DNA-directed RNA polymerase subunit beta (DUF616) [Wolffia australiana]